MSRGMAVVVTELIDSAQDTLLKIGHPEAIKHGLRPDEAREYTEHYLVIRALEIQLKPLGGHKRYSRFMSDRRRHRLLNTMKIRFGDSIQQQRTIDNVPEDALVMQDAAYRFIVDNLDKLGKKLTPKASNKPVLAGGKWQ